MRTNIIYNTYDKKYYYADEIIPYPQKSRLHMSNKFCISAKTEPTDDKDGYLNELLEDNEDFKTPEARLYFNNKLGIVVISKDVMEDIPGFLKRLEDKGYSCLIIEEYWYTKFLAWKKDGNVRFIIQNYDEDEVEVIFDKLIPEDIFFNEFNKLYENLKEGLQKVKKLYKQYKQEEELLKSLQWMFDTSNKKERLQEYIDIDDNSLKSKILKNFIKKVKDKSSKHTVDWKTKREEICVHQGDFYYKVKNHKLIRFYYLERNSSEILRYIKKHNIKINTSIQLSKLYADMVKNSGREAMECYLGENKVTIYEDGGFDAPLVTEKEREYLEDVIYQIVKDNNKNKFPVKDFHDLLRKYGIRTCGYCSDRIMRISYVETYQIHNAIEKELIAAAEAGNVERIKSLIKKGVDVNYVNYRYDTALSKAVSCGHLEIAKLLLKHGADINYKDNKGYTILHYALFAKGDAKKSGNIEMIKFLLKKGAQRAGNIWGYDEFFNAAEASENPEVLELFYDDGAHINQKYKWDYTPLMCAVRCAEKPETTKYLIEKGADIDAVDYEGVSILMHATFNVNDDPTIVKLLVDSGCKVDAKSNEGKTALDYAEFNSKHKIAEYLHTVIKQTEDNTKHYDTIDFKIQPAGTLDMPWADCDRVVILINGRDILDIIREKEKKLFAAEGLDTKGAGGYHYLWPSDLYVYLAYAGLTDDEDYRAPILCCSCDEVGCSSVRVKVKYSSNSVIWKDFRSCRPEWNWGLEYEFEYKAYEDFMQRIKALPDNRQR